MTIADNSDTRSDTTRTIIVGGDTAASDGSSGV